MLNHFHARRQGEPWKQGVSVEVPVWLRRSNACLSKFGKMETPPPTMEHEKTWVLQSQWKYVLKLEAAHEK